MSNQPPDNSFVVPTATDFIKMGYISCIVL